MCALVTLPCSSRLTSLCLAIFVFTWVLNSIVKLHKRYLWEIWLELNYIDRLVREAILATSILRIHEPDISYYLIRFSLSVLQFFVCRMFYIPFVKFLLNISYLRCSSKWCLLIYYLYFVHIYKKQLTSMLISYSVILLNFYYKNILDFILHNHIVCD